MQIEPVIISGSGPYIFKWQADGIIVTVDRIDDGKRAVTAELTIATYPQMDHISQSRFNFTSSKARADLSRTLKAQIPNIESILETLCLTFLKQLRTGEPVIAVGNLPRRGELAYRLKPLILENAANLIYGAGGIGKSYVALLSALLVQLGRTTSGLIPKKGNVLYLDYETSADEINERILNLKEGLGITSTETISYRPSSNPLYEEVPELRRVIAERQIELLIVDSIGAAAGGEPESAEVTLRLFGAIRSLKVTALCIDHVAKAGIAGTPFGSVYKINAVRNLFEMKKNQEPGEDFINVALMHRKMNVGKLIKPLGYRFDFSESKTEVSQVSVERIPELSKELPLKDRIKSALLEAGKMSTKDLAEELDTSPSSIRGILSRHNSEFIKMGNTWGVRRYEA